MSTATPRTERNGHHGYEDIREVQSDWTVLTGVGALTILTGLALAVGGFLMSGSAALAFTFMMLLAALIQLGGSYASRPWVGSVTAIINGVVYGFIAYALYSAHASEVTGLMLAVAILLLTLGICRVGLALVKSFTLRELTLFNGVVGLVMGAMIFGAWYGQLAWAVGPLLGIEVIMTGIIWIAFSRALRHSREAAT